MLYKACEDNKDELIDFLNQVAFTNRLNDELLINACFLKEENIKGAISYEIYQKTGLIKYFVFYKNLDEEKINKLYNFAYENASDKINRMISICFNYESIDLFLKLGFKELNKNNFFINDVNILNTEYKDALVLEMVP